MKDTEREQSLIRKYLLGELDEHQREQLEQRVITTPDFKEEVLITEEDLLEEFVSGTLSPRELESFTRMYSSSPAQRRKVKIAQALNDYALKHSPVVQPMAHKSWTKSLIELFSVKSRFHQFSLAALIIVLVVGGAVLVYWLISHQRRDEQTAVLLLNQPSSEVMEPSASVVSESLPPLLFRGIDESRTITITKQTTTVQLRLPDPSGGTNAFRAILNTSNGSEVFSLEDLRARQIDQQWVLVLQIPAQLLPPQDYQLNISEKRPDGSYESPSIYPFRVTKSP